MQADIISRKNLKKEALIDEISRTLHHGCTEINAVGTYTGTERFVLIRVINKHQLNDFHEIISKYSDTFSYYEIVNETYGNFKHIK